MISATYQKWRKIEMIRVIPFLFSILLFLIGCKENLDDLLSDKDKPAIASMNPAQVSRGQQNVNGLITGTNFNGIVAVDLGSGIQILDTVVNNSSEISVRFNVNQDAPSGIRTIKVTTLGGVAESATALSVKDTRAPVALFTVDPSKGGKMTVFRFDASDSSDPDGRITGYVWDFGDNKTGTGKIIEHQYDLVGEFDVLLTVTDNESSQSIASRKIQVENIRPPVARYSVDPPHGSVDTIFRFDGSNSEDRDGRIVKYEWDFKDGTILDGKVVRHQFQKSDDFNVKLTVTDNDGLEAFFEREVEVRGVPPIARISISPQSGDTNTTFRFDASESEDPDGNIVEYDWKFAGGSHFTQKTFERTFPENGTYSFTLTVVDDDGMEDSTSDDLEITTGGGGGGGDDDDDDGGEGECKNPAKNRGLIFGTVIGVDGFNAIVRFPSDATCANSFYMCGDMRRADPERFRGIIKRMEDLGNNTFSIFNDCPFEWPPDIGEEIFIYYKTCAENFCP
jgi:hypothetical protein